MMNKRGSMSPACGGRVVAMLSLAGMLTFATPVLRANAAWTTTDAGKMYTQTASPGYVTGLKTIGSYTYYFNADGIMQTGLQKIGDNLYFFSSEGIMQKGWIHTDTKKYYADKTGVLAVSQWVNNYYFQADGSLAVNKWIDGKWVGENGKYTGVKNNVGWVTENGKTYYYDSDGNLVKGWLTLSGHKYYLNPSTGVLQKGWIRVGSYYYYGGPSKGVIQKSMWIDGKYVKKSGRMATGLTTIKKKTYLFDSSGYKKTGWQTYNDKIYYFDTKGVMAKSKWIGTKYVNKKGVMHVNRFATIKGSTYYFNASGDRQTGWLTLDNNKYYLNKAGKLMKKRWFLSKKYYAGSDGAILKGLHAIGSNIYFFDETTGLKLTHSKKVIGNDTYYFKKNGVAAKNKWIKLQSKYYYFDNAGKMVRSTWVGKYYVGSDGARTDQEKQTGWSESDGKKYYFDANGNMVTGFMTLSGNTYYFDSTGAMVTGLQTIGVTKYYFYADGTMAVSVSIIVGAKQYVINASGVVTSETSIKIDGTTTGAQIVNYALQFIGNPYVYGGTDPVKGSDCSGFVQTIFSNFGYKLLRIADDQMKGPSATKIQKEGYTTAVTVDISSIQPGDLLFYGSANYASHVAIYIGNNQIVHASNSQPYPKGGVKISNYDYQTPIKAVRYWS